MGLEVDWEDGRVAVDGAGDPLFLEDGVLPEPRAAGDFVGQVVRIAVV